MVPRLLRGKDGRFALAALAVAVLCAGCFPKTAAAPPALSAGSVAKASARWKDGTAEALSMGHDRFVAKCNGCHGYPDLPAIADERWPAIVERMANKAHLGPEERDAILHYILASRQEQAGR
jgi:hypothetical protein